jgi:hypothetical protein
MSRNPLITTYLKMRRRQSEVAHSYSRVNSYLCFQFEVMSFCLAALLYALMDETSSSPKILRMSDAPDYAALVRLFPVLRNCVDGCGEVTLTVEEAAQIRLLGFPAEEGRWKVPPVPPESVRDNPLLEHLSIGWGIRRDFVRPLSTDAVQRERQTEKREASTTSKTRYGLTEASASALKPLPTNEEPGADVNAKQLRQGRQEVLEGCNNRERTVAKPRRQSKKLRTRRNRVFCEALRTLADHPEQRGTLIYPDRAWGRLRYKGMKLRDWLFQSRPVALRPPTSTIRELEWSIFKRMCAADGNWLPWLVFHLGPQYAGMFERRRPRRARGSDPFENMPEPYQSKARTIFRRLCNRWAWNLPSWRKAILAGRARRLATCPPDSKWGRTMRAKRGGYAVQEKYRREGRHPLGLNVSQHRHQALTKRP